MPAVVGALGVVLAFLLALLSQSLPGVTPASAPDGEFSAERAQRVVQALAGDIGYRTVGTAAYRRATADLVERLKAIPGVEVEVQQAEGVQNYEKAAIPYPPFVYRAANVIARLPGRTRDAVLLDAHYDSWTDGIGAGDDAMGVAVVVEALRALASGPRPERTVIALLNGGEEGGMFAAAGFLSHPLARDVRAYVYYDGSPRGRATLLYAGPGNQWLTAAFTAADPRPTGWVLGQDLIDSGVLPHDGDFHPFADGGLVGLSYGAVADMWSPHTPLDRPDRIDLPSLQHMGDGLLAGVRRLASMELPGAADPRRFVYYDLLGRTMVVYSHGAARALALAAIALVGAALVAGRRRGLYTSREVARAAGRIVLVGAALFVGAIAAGALCAFALHRPHGWFSAPWLAVWAFGGSGAALALFALALRRRVTPGDEGRAEVTLWAGALALWAVVAALAAVAEVGAGYLALWAAAPGALGLLLALRYPAWRRLLWLGAFLPGATLTLELAVVLVPFAVGDTGLVAAPIPLDVLIGAVVALFTSWLLPLLLVPLGGVVTSFRPALAMLVVAAVGIGALCVHAPYTAERPKRVRAAVEERDGKAALLVASSDSLPLDPAALGLPEAQPAADAHLPFDAFYGPFTHQVPSSPPRIAAPALEVIESRHDAARGVRVVRARLRAEGTQLRLLLPLTALAGWSFGPVPRESVAGDRALVIFEDPSPAQKEFTLELKGTDAVEVEARDLRATTDHPDLEALRRRLPPWVALHALEIRGTTTRM